MTTKQFVDGIKVFVFISMTWIMWTSFNLAWERFKEPSFDRKVQIRTKELLIDHMAEMQVFEEIHGEIE